MSEENNNAERSAHENVQAAALTDCDHNRDIGCKKDDCGKGCGDNDSAVGLCGGKQSIRVTRSDPLACTSGRSHSIRSSSGGGCGGSRHSSHSHSHSKVPNYHSKERRARWIRDKMSNYYYHQQHHSDSSDMKYNSNINGPGPGPRTSLYHRPVYHPFSRYHLASENGSAKVINHNHPYPSYRGQLVSMDSSGAAHLPYSMSNGDTWDESGGAANSAWISGHESKSPKFHRPYSVREQRSWAHPPPISSGLLQSVEEGNGRQRLKAGLSLPVPVENGRYLEFKEGNLHRYSGNSHHHPIAGDNEIDGLDHNNFETEDQDDDQDADGEDDNKIGRLSTSFHFTRQTRPPYPYRLKTHHNNLSGGGRSRDRSRDCGGDGALGIGTPEIVPSRSGSQSPCSITSESAESQGEKALDPPRLSLPDEDSVGGLVASGINGGNRGRKLSVLFASYDAWSEDNIVQSFKEMTPTATSIFEAAWTGNLNALEELLSEDGDSKEHKENLKKLRASELRDSEGRTPLHLASACGHVPCVELLLSKGTEVNCYDGNENRATPLACAASCGSDQVVRVLLDHGADVNSGYDQGKTALHWAIQAGSVECAKILLEAGAKQNPPQVYSETPLHVAAALGDPVCLQLLLDHGADVNLCKGSNRSTALHLSAEEGNASCVRLLLKAGASHAAKDIRGHTALHVAATCDADSVITLLKAGADPNIVDSNGRTPLHCAVSRGSRAAECVRLLVENGADIDAQDNYGYTPLHLSAVNESSQCASILLHHGSDVTLKTNAGVNALSMLVRKIPDVMRYLVERLDSAVTVHDHDPADPDCEIRLDFRAIVPNCEKKGGNNGKSHGNGYIKSNEGSGGSGGGDKRDYYHKPHKETEFLTCLVAAGNKKILAHPLSEAFLTLKWRRVRKFFWASLLFQIALVALFTIYVVEVYLIHCPYRRSHHHRNVDPSSEPFMQETVAAWMPGPGPSGSYDYNNTHYNLSDSKFSDEALNPDGGTNHNISRRSADPVFRWFSLSVKKQPTTSRPTTTPPPLTSTTRRLRARTEQMRFKNGTLFPLPTPFTTKNSPAINESESSLGHLPDQISCEFTSALRVIWILLVVFASILALKEVFQLLQSPLSYIVSSENWGQWLLITSVTMTAWSSPLYQLEYWQYPAAACGIFLAWGLMLLQVGRFPALGLYVQMLGKVAANFGLFILAYACLLMAFALAFCVLFPESPPYSSVPLSILKVFTMMVGEVDYEDLFYDDMRADDPMLFPLTAHVLYGAFVVIVTIVLMNLLVGLAVHDIQGLQKGAKLNRLSRQTALISRLESFIFSKKLQSLLPRSLGSILQKSALLVPSSYNWSFYFRPNDPRDKRLPKDIKLASLRLAASRHSSSKSKTHHHHHHHHHQSSTNHQYIHGQADLSAAGARNTTLRPLSSISQPHLRNQSRTSGRSSGIQHHPSMSIQRIEQRLDNLQMQLDRVLGSLNGRVEVVLDILLEQRPELRSTLKMGLSETENEQSCMEDSVFSRQSTATSPSPSVRFKRPSFATEPSVLKDVSCEKG